MAQSKLKIIAVGQRKGGPGKTTLTKTLAEYLVLEKNLRVLMVDFDSQCNLSQLFLDMEVTDQGIRPPVYPDYDPNNPEDAKWSGRSSSANMFMEGPILPYQVVTPEGADTLEIIPGDSRLLTMVEEQDSTQIREKVIERPRELFSHYLTADNLDDFFDVLIFDTSPSASPLTRAAVRVATHLLIPVELEEQCFEGMIEMLSLLHEENRRRPSSEELKILAIQPNKVKMRRTVHQSFLEGLKNHRASRRYLSPVLIPDKAEFAERDLKGASPRSIYQLPASNKARRIAMEFGDFIYSKMYDEGSVKPGVEEDATHDQTAT